MIYRTHADLGGRGGHGAVVPDPNERVFHADWEGRTHAIEVAMRFTGAWNVDMSRSARETLPDYARLPYYARWFEALQSLLIERGLIGQDEVAAGRMLHPALPMARLLRAEQVGAWAAQVRLSERPATSPSRFKVGEAVCTRSSQAGNHTRLPGYARGKIGCIEQIRGVHVFADTHAHGLGEQPQWLYSVVFDGRQLWGDEAPEGLSVAIDAWEPYLEPFA
ncbi:MAG: nitrile hydratase subunit beta [Burkholderiaceae bacterium]|nr:nitrile hydratase subunit beta [Burkholderiaceae bacterium]